MEEKHENKLNKNVNNTYFQGLTIKFLSFPGFSAGVWFFHAQWKESEECWVSCMILDPHTSLLLLPRQTSTSKWTADDLHPAASQWPRSPLECVSLLNIRQQVLQHVLFFFFLSLSGWFRPHSVCLQILNIGFKQGSTFTDFFFQNVKITLLSLLNDKTLFTFLLVWGVHIFALL